MPNNKVLQQKKDIVSNLADKMSRAVSGVFVDYLGLSVEEDTQLRNELRAANVEYRVVKNTLTKFAADQIGFEGLDECLNGPTSLALSFDDVVAPAKILSKFAESHEGFAIKAGFIEGKVVEKEAIDQLAKLPSKEVLVAKALGGLNAPIAGFANVLNANLRGLAIVLNAIAEQKSA